MGAGVKQATGGGRLRVAGSGFGGVIFGNLFIFPRKSFSLVVGLMLPPAKVNFFDGPLNLAASKNRFLIADEARICR